MCQTLRSKAFVHLEFVHAFHTKEPATVVINCIIDWVKGALFPHTVPLIVSTICFCFCPYKRLTFDFAAQFWCLIPVSNHFSLRQVITISPLHRWKNVFAQWIQVKYFWTWKLTLHISGKFTYFWSRHWSNSWEIIWGMTVPWCLVQPFDTSSAALK